MKMKKHISFCLAALFAQSALADDNAKDSRVLLITGSPMQQNIEGSSEQLDEYDNQAIIDAGDLLTRFPGISAIRAGGHGVDPVLRGQSQTRINLLQQGAFLHGAGPNRMDSPGSYTEPFGWDEIQIIKGVETLVFGSGGPSGTINFKRYRPFASEDGVSGKLMAAYSGDYYKLGADLSLSGEQGYARLISQQHDQKSYKDGDGKRTRTAFETTSNTLIAGYTPDEETELRISIMSNRGSDALFAGTMMDGPTTDMDAAQLMFLDGDEGSNDYSEYQVYWNKAHHVMDNFSLRQQTAPMRMLTDAYAKTRGAKWLKRWQSDSIVWQTSFDWQNIERHAERYMGMMGVPQMLQSRIWPENELDIKGAAIEAEYLIDDNSRLKSGIRFDAVKAKSVALDTPSVKNLYQTYYVNTPSSSNENNISAFSRYYFNQEKALYWVGVSSTARTADATERYIGANNNRAMMRWVGNPDIQPERHNQLEIGAKWRFDAGWHELNVYYDKISDFILRDRAHAQSGIKQSDMATVYRNTDVTLSGFEWALQKSFADDWIFYTNLAYVKGSIDESNRSLYQIPPIEGVIQLSQEKDELAYWFDVRWALSQDNVDDNRMTGSALDAGESDPWVSVNFKVRYDLNESWQLSAGIDNLFDRTYAYHVSRANLDPFNPDAARVNEPGRQVWISVLTEL